MSIHSVHYLLLLEFYSFYLSSLKCFTKEYGCLINLQISLSVKQLCCSLGLDYWALWLTLLQWCPQPGLEVPGWDVWPWGGVYGCELEALLLLFLLSIMWVNLGCH